MQEKKNQHILFTKENSPKNRSLLSKLLKKYPFALNIRYKHLELSTLHSKVLDPIELKKLSTYAIDKQYLKMRFKKLNKSKDSYWLNPETADQANIPESNLPEESIEQDAVIIPVSTISEPETNQKQPNDVEQKTNEQNLTMSAKKNKDEKEGQSPEETRFTDWLEGLKKSSKSDNKSSETAKKKKKKKKKKAKKDKAKKKHELEQAEIISETLAELMAKQGYTEKAIEMYNRLSLLFPEKNSYFASKIEDLNN